jgi:proline dehydrogenase
VFDLKFRSRDYFKNSGKRGMSVMLNLTDEEYSLLERVSKSRIPETSIEDLVRWWVSLQLAEYRYPLIPLIEEEESVTKQEFQELIERVESLERITDKSILDLLGLAFIQKLTDKNDREQKKGNKK